MIKVTFRQCVNLTFAYEYVVSKPPPAEPLILDANDVQFNCEGQFVTFYKYTPRKGKDDIYNEPQFILAIRTDNIQRIEKIDD